MQRTSVVIMICCLLSAMCHIAACGISEGRKRELNKRLQEQSLEVLLIKKSNGLIYRVQAKQSSDGRLYIPMSDNRVVLLKSDGSVEGSKVPATWRRFMKVEE